MARRSSSKSPQRDPNAISSQGLPGDLFPLRPIQSLLTLFDDRRLFHPLDEYRPAATFSRRSFSRVVDKAPLKASMPASNFHFAVPEKVIACVRRKDRREVLFAKRKTGKGAHSRKRRNYWSDVRC